MAAVATEAGPWAERRRRVAELRTRRGFVRQLLDFYGALLPVQQKAYLDAGTARPAASDLAAYVAELVLPSVVDVSIAAGPDRLRSAVIHWLDTQSTRVGVERWIDGEEQSMVERFVARAAVEPVLEAASSEVKGVCRGTRDARHCPQCGGPPQLSFVAAAGEDLATGRRYLLCARCGSGWGYPRMTCAGCGENASAKLVILSEEGTLSGERGGLIRGLPQPQSPPAHPAVFPHIRIEACDSCRRYLLGIDISQDPPAVPIVDELTAVPLDLVARERGYTKITPNLMGF